MMKAIRSEPGGQAAARGLGVRLVQLLALAALGLGLTWASLHRGPWYDEFYTWFVTRPDRPFMAGLRHSWLADNHPPLFDILAWLGAHLAGSIETLRLLNLAALALAGLGGWVLQHRLPQYWPLTAAFVLVLVADEAALRSGTELRSYFLSYCSGAMVVLALTIGWLEGGLHSRGQRLVLGAALLAGLNLHILTSVIVGALLVPFLAAAWLRGRRALAWQVLAPALVAGGLFVAVSAVQLPLWQANTANFWIPAGFNAARWSIEYAVLRAAEADPAVLLGAVIGALLLGWTAWQDRRLGAALECMALLGAGLALAAALMTGLHLLRPVVMERYLAAMIPAVAMGLALGCAEALRRLPLRWSNLGLLAATAAALWALVGNAAHTVQRNSWSGSAAAVAALQRACPDSPVHIDPPFWNAYTMALPPADNRMVFGRAHAMMAQRYGVRLEPAASRRISSTCPTLFWAEHDTSRTWDEAAILAHLRRQGFTVERIWQARIGDGWIAANRPLDAAAAR